MDFTVHSGSEQGAFQTTARELLGQWRKSLDLCLRKPSRKRVHALRRATLRLLSILDFALRELPRNASLRRSFRRWKKQACKLRRALRPLRDGDVFLRRLAELRAKIAAEPVCDPPCLYAIKLLDCQLRHLRRQRKNIFLAEIKQSRPRLVRRCKQLEAALLVRNKQSVSTKTTPDLPECKERIPVRDSLHAYRKRLRRELYCAEIATPPLATALRNIVSAVGDWHDWQALATEAKHQLPQTAAAALALQLEAMAEGALARALGLCHCSDAPTS